MPFSRVRWPARRPPEPAAPCGGGGSPSHVFHAQGAWLEPKYGEGPYCCACMVILPQDKAGAAPAPLAAESERLAEYPFPEDMATT
jgi:hypothetical protein